MLFIFTRSQVKAWEVLVQVNLVPRSPTVIVFHVIALIRCKMTVIGFCLFSISFVVVIRYLSFILPPYNFGQFKWKIEGTPSLPSLPHFNHGGKKARSGLSESIIDFFRGGRGGEGESVISLCVLPKIVALALLMLCTVGKRVRK